MNRYETTFTLTVSIVAEDEEKADQESTRRQIKLLEANPWIKYLKPSEVRDAFTDDALFGTGLAG